MLCSVGHDANVRQLAKRSEQEGKQRTTKRLQMICLIPCLSTARQLLEPTTENLKAAASNVYDDLKEIGGDYAEQAEEYMEELFPEILEEEKETEKEELAKIKEEILDDSKPLEHLDDEVKPVIASTQVPEFAKGHGHHNNKNGTHRRPTHGHKHNSTHGNDTDGPVFQPERYFTEPIITGLLVSFLIFIPLVGMGIMALSSIQVRSSARTGRRRYADASVYRYRLTLWPFPRRPAYRSRRRSNRDLIIIPYFSFGIPQSSFEEVPIRLQIRVNRRLAECIRYNMKYTPWTSPCYGDPYI